MWEVIYNVLVILFKFSVVMAGLMILLYGFMFSSHNGYWWIEGYWKEMLVKIHEIKKEYVK